MKSYKTMNEAFLAASTHVLPPLTGSLKRLA